MDILRSSNEWLEGKRRDVLSNDVTYIRGAVELSLVATFGTSQFEAEESDGVITDTQTRDFIITRTDFEDTFNVPQEGDRIEVTENGTILTFEVKAPRGFDVYSVDNYLLSFRIHSQIVIEVKGDGTYYNGVGPAGLTPAEIMALSSFPGSKQDRTVSESPNTERFYYAFPASFGPLSEVLDPSGFDIFSDYTLRVEDFSGTSYYVYEYDHDTTQTAFSLSYNF